MDAITLALMVLIAAFIVFGVVLISLSRHVVRLERYTDNLAKALYIIANSNGKRI
jgi:hypothetical protein